MATANVVGTYKRLSKNVLVLLQQPFQSYSFLNHLYLFHLTRNYHFSINPKTKMDCVRKFCASFGQTFITEFLKQGDIPKHVAIIMDGNRRYARKNGMPGVKDGHKKGAKTLRKMLDVFSYLGISEVTIYSFSNDNFKRTEDEVKGLMEVFTDKLQDLFDDLDDLKEMGMSVDVVGDYAKSPSSRVKTLFAKLMWFTKEHKKIRLNLAFAYTGQEEIVKSLNTLLHGLIRNELKIKDLNEDLCGKAQSIRISSKWNPVDLLIRTGGDHRISDFMMWQSGSAYIDFISEITWPEFNSWHLGRSIWRYQMQKLFGEFGFVKDDKNERNLEEKGEGEIRRQMFLKRREDVEWEEIKEIAC